MLAGWPCLCSDLPSSDAARHNQDQDEQQEHQQAATGGHEPKAQLGKRHHDGARGRMT